MQVIESTTYEENDAAYMDRMKGYQSAWDWWLINHYRVVSAFHEHLVESFCRNHSIKKVQSVDEFHTFDAMDFKILSLYYSTLIGLDHGLGEFNLADAPFYQGISVRGEGYEMLYELEPDKQLIQRCKEQTIEIMSEHINHSSVAS